MTNNFIQFYLGKNVYLYFIMDICCLPKNEIARIIIHIEFSGIVFNCPLLSFPPSLSLVYPSLIPSLLCIPFKKYTELIHSFRKKIRGRINQSSFHFFNEMFLAHNFLCCNHASWPIFQRSRHMLKPKEPGTVTSCFVFQLYDRQCTIIVIFNWVI